MDEQLTDEQQAEIARNWLRENGVSVVGGIVVAVGALFGWQQWQGYQRAQAERASAAYEELLLALRGARNEQANVLFREMEERFSGSVYIAQARLLLARSSMDRNDFEAAAEHLAAVVDSAGSAELRHIARLRLARVRLQQQQYDAALAVLGSVTPDSAFAARYDEIRGDIYYAQNRVDDARIAYEAALSSPQQPPVIDRVYVQAKLDALGGGTTVAEPGE
ncbi:MAG: YfgM family protein [Gammaproteobacteria bacterium]